VGFVHVHGDLGIRRDMELAIQTEAFADERFGPSERDSTGGNQEQGVISQQGGLLQRALAGGDGLPPEPFIDGQIYAQVASVFDVIKKENLFELSE